jgi:hypothetical protein
LDVEHEEMVTLTTIIVKNGIMALLPRLPWMADPMPRRIGWTLLLALTVGCAGQSSVKHEPALSTAEADDGLGNLQPRPDSMDPVRVHVEAPKRAVVGTAVPVKLVVSNTGSTKVEILQTPAPQDYNLSIARKHGRIVWQRWPPDAALSTAGDLYSLAPGQSRELETISWDQRDLNGRQVGLGRYEIQGIFFGGVAYSGHSEIQSDTVSLLIER